LVVKIALVEAVLIYRDQSLWRLTSRIWQAGEGKIGDFGLLMLLMIGS